MGVAGLFKKIKNGISKVTNKVKNTVKTVANKVVNTGANLVQKWANVNSTLTNGVNKALNVVGNFLPGVGKVIAGAGKVATGLWTNVYDKIGDVAGKVANKTSSSSSSSSNKIGISLLDKIRNNSTSNQILTGSPNIVNRNNLGVDINQRNPLLNPHNTNYTTGLKIKRTGENGAGVLKSQPDVIVNNYYNRGPRRDYIQRRHPSNPQYNVREIGPRRFRQPPIIDPQHPIDIQRRNYYTKQHMRRGENWNRNNPYSGNIAISW